MTRSQILYRVVKLGSDSDELVLQNASVDIYRTGTMARPALWTLPTGGSSISGTLHTDATGMVDAWLDEAEGNIVDLVVTDNTGSCYLAGQPARRQTFPSYTLTVQARGATGTVSTPFVDRGAWASGGTYHAGDVVSFAVGGITNEYINAVDVTGSTTTPDMDTGHWRLWLSGASATITNIDGGSPDSVYTIDQIIDCGSP